MLLASLRNSAQGISALIAAFFVESRIRTSITILAGTAISGIGAIINAGGIYSSTYALMIIGHMMIGSCLEVLNVSQYIITIKVYNDFFLNTIISLQFAIIRIGGFVAYQVVNKLYRAVDTRYYGAKKLGITNFIIDSSISNEIVFATLLALIYERYRSRDRQEEPIDARRPLSVHLQQKKRDKKQHIFAVLSDIVNDLSKLSKEQVLIIISASIYKPVIESIMLQVIEMNMRKYERTWISAMRLSSYFELIHGVSGPFVGLALDYFQSNFLFMCIGLLISLIGISLMSFTFISVVGMVLVSIGYSIYVSSYWIVIAHSKTTNHSFNISFGLFCLSIGRTIITAVSGYILEHYGYFYIFIIYLGLLMVLSLPMNSFAFFKIRYSPLATFNYRGDEGEERLLSVKK
ncbi:MAG: Major facilitator superfamily domain-containing protein 1, variant 2 [Marteilia pararefringens]